MEQLGLQRKADVVSGNLSHGDQKLLDIALALVLRPKVLLLDEPSSGLNVEETDDMAYWIQDIRDELDITVLMVEHDMSLVNRVSDRVLAVNYGKVLAEGGIEPGFIMARIDPAEVTKARRILAAMEEAAKAGRGAVSLDGRLIDYASIRQAEVLVKKAEMIAGA